MLSCLADTVQRPATKRDLLSSAESRLSTLPHDFDHGYSLRCPAAHRANEELPSMDNKNGFFKLLGLAPAQLPDLRKQTEILECDVIVIDDEEEENDRTPDRRQSYTTTRPLRSNAEVDNGIAVNRLLQPCSRLRKLLSVDISSTLGFHTLPSIISALKKDVMPLNPYTVLHSLAGSDNTLDYGTFCRTPVKGMLGRLRHREFPVKYRQEPGGTHYHYYCFDRNDRRKFCRRFDSGLSGKSRRLRRKYSCCSVAMERLTENEVSDWHSSQRLRDYVMRMEEKDKAAEEKAEREKAAKEKAAAIINLSRNAAANDDIISLSSDSEDEMSSPAKKQDLMFRCHQCDVKLPCGGTFRNLIRDHYRTCHGIVDIDILRILQPDGSTTMQVIHVPVSTAVTQRPAAATSNSPATCIAPTAHQSSTLIFPYSNPSQSQTFPASPRVPSQRHPASGAWRAWPSTAGDFKAVISTAAKTQAHAVNLPLSGTLTEAIHSYETISPPVSLVPLRRKLVYKNSALLNGNVSCRGDASAESSCDADVICLD